MIIDKINSINKNNISNILLKNKENLLIFIAYTKYYATYNHCCYSRD